uniref:Uncharacterized protein n=1 Tax=Bracon brevicornis TaxID=1563983 RepID=A0A6V7L4L5_9HYME
MNSWCIRQYHGIRWEDESIPYTQLKTKFAEIVRNTQKVYVKGYEKRIWVAEFIEIPVIDLEELECPSVVKLRRLPHKLHREHHGLHLKYYNCAFENVQRMRSWFIETCMS